MNDEQMMALVESRLAVAKAAGWVVEWDYHITCGIPRFFVQDPAGDTKMEAWDWGFTDPARRLELLDLWGVPAEPTPGQVDRG